MGEPRIGALFAGYGGLEMGVQSVLGGDLAWYSEIDKGALKILTHHHPDVPNVGDITTVDWSTVEPVDILTGGSPCQDLSHAGKRAGMTDGTRSNLWVAMREAIAQLRPGLVVWENVRGAYSAEADSDLEFCPGCMGDGRPGTVLRALGRVLGDLSDLGYDAGWHGLRAADVGAPHGRMRVFVTAYPSGDAGRLSYGDGAATALADHGGPRDRCSRQNRGSESLDSVRDGSLLPTPIVSDAGVSAWDYGPRDFTQLRDLAHLLPTPRATDGTKGGPNQRGSSGDLMLPSAVTLLPTPTSQAAKHTSDDRGPGTLDDCNLWSVATRLLPTPSVADVQGGRKARSGERSDEPLLNGIAHANLWGEYAEAIARWEHVLGRPAPAPTMTSTKGNPQLAPAFVEWMMGLPPGHVTDAPGITRNEALKALGNGVVPQQAEGAIRYLLGALEVAA